MNIKASNIKCGGCANQIKSSLLQIEGVSSCEVDVETGTIELGTDSQEVVDIVKKKLASMGYPEDNPSTLQTAKSYVSCMVGRMKTEA